MIGKGNVPLHKLSILSLFFVFFGTKVNDEIQEPAENPLNFEFSSFLPFLFLGGGGHIPCLLNTMA